MIEATIHAIEEGFREAGFSYRVAGIEVLDNLNETFAMLRERGLVSESLLQASMTAVCGSSRPPKCRRCARWWSSPPRRPLSRYGSIWTRVRSRPSYRPRISRPGLRARCLEVLEKALAPEGFSVARVPVPVKLLAVRTGLAEYGRNNIAYTQTLGSFVRLDTFATDADLVPPGGPRAGLSTFLVGGRDPATGHWSPPRRMGSCGACKACYHACPTGCIPFPDTGVVIDAERCLTYLNEHEGEWPDWLDPAAHNALVGCMRCQLICPANKYHLRREKVVAEFDREETEVVLLDLPSEDLPELGAVQARPSRPG